MVQKLKWSVFIQPVKFILSNCSLVLKVKCLRSIYSAFRTDSEIFEDSGELQQFFVKIRDELCKNGEILLSPALSYTSKHLHSDVDQEKREKLPQEIEEDRVKREEDKKGLLLLCSSKLFGCFWSWST